MQTTPIIEAVPNRARLTSAWKTQLIKFLIAMLLFPLTLLLKLETSQHPEWVETVYSRHIYPALTQCVNLLFRWVPFSVAEFAAYALVVGIVAYLFYQLARLVLHRQRVLRAISVVTNLALLGSVGYFLFIGLWGLNYNREPLATSLGYTVEPRSVSELKKLCTQLAVQANEQRAGLQQNLHGYVTYPEGKHAALQKVPLAYRALAEKSNLFEARYGAPKAVMLSRMLSYTEIEGVYIAFTAEANLNTDMPDALFLSAACHEVAHQYGFAREDEANFIAYLACQASDDPELMYSGTLLALIHSMNALYGYDADAYGEIADTYDKGVKRDINYQTLYWRQFEGPVAETSTKVNNAYLMSNNQTDGVNSYGRMVELLLAQMSHDGAGK